MQEEVQLSRNSGTAVEKKYCKSLLQIDALLK